MLYNANDANISTLSMKVASKYVPFQTVILMSLKHSQVVLLMLPIFVSRYYKQSKKYNN
jgi:hypothetical protein